MRTRGARSAVLAVAAVVAVGCSSGRDDGTATEGPGDRGYWPTAGWRTADPAEHGFDDQELDEIERLTTEVYPSMRSLVVVRAGYVIHEYYREGLGPDDGHDVRSVTKSVIGVLVGIALRDGTVDGVDATVGELLGPHVPPGADPRISGATLADLLSMTAGLPGDDGAAGGDTRVLDALFASPDWAQHALGTPLEADPGTEWAYSNASSHLLSVVVADATGRSTLDFAQERLFGPLGIDTDDAFEPVLGPSVAQADLDRYAGSRVAWPVDPQGYHYGGALLRLPARDLAKIGFLYLNEGEWDGEQVVTADFVQASTTAEEGTPAAEAGYGWQWWLDETGSSPAYFARGYGGQIIHVVPELDLVTVGTNDPEAPGAPDLLGFVGAAVVLAAED